MAGPPTRADDERLLWLLRARLAGRSARAAGLGAGPEGREGGQGPAGSPGLTGARVRTATNRVRDADLSESGEAIEVVAGFYQWGA